MVRFGTPSVRGALFCLAAGVAFSVSPILIQIAYAHGAAVSGVLAWRYLAAAILLALLAGPRLRQVPLRVALAALALGACIYALDSALFFGALERTSAPLASLVHYAHLALVVGGAALAGRERLTQRRAVALAGIFGGVSLVGAAATNPDAVGIAMALGSATAYGVYILLSDRLLRDVDPMALTAYLTAGAAASFLVAGTVLGSLGTVGGPAGLLCLAAAACIGSVFAVSTFLRGVRLVGPSTASLLVTVEVPVTIALAGFVLKQHLTPPQLGGAALVVGAILVLQVRRRPRLSFARRSVAPTAIERVEQLAA